MIYYAIYLKGLQNNTGYVDVALDSDELMKDFLAFLDMGLKAHRTYNIADPGKPTTKTGKTGKFAVNLSDIMAITVVQPS